MLFQIHIIHTILYKTNILNINIINYLTNLYKTILK